MAPLAEIQRRVREAVVTGQVGGIESLLAGGEAGIKRFAIHCRQYEASLVSVLVEKFPGTGWLAGTAFVEEAARHFVRAHPPETPPIAEYGEGFPAFIAERPGAERVPYMKEFAELEWHVGHAAIAVEKASVCPEELTSISPDLLPDAKFTLQGGAGYLEARWPIDELLKLYLAETAPEYFVFDPAPVNLEIRGARGEFSITRLDRGNFLFRKALREGRSIADAVERALDADQDFDPVKALAEVFAADLIVAVTHGGLE